MQELGEIRTITEKSPFHKLSVKGVDMNNKKA